MALLRKLVARLQRKLTQAVIYEQHGNFSAWFRRMFQLSNMCATAHTHIEDQFGWFCIRWLLGTNTPPSISKQISLRNGFFPHFFALHFFLVSWNFESLWSSLIFPRKLRPIPRPAHRAAGCGRRCRRPRCREAWWSPAFEYCCSAARSWRPWCGRCRWGRRTLPRRAAGAGVPGVGMVEKFMTNGVMMA